MLTHLAKRITNKLYTVGFINEKDHDSEICCFGIEIGIAMTTHILTTIVIGIAFRMLVESIIFLLAFMLIRSYAGGYHASTHLKCYFLSITALSVILFIVKHGLYSVVLAIIGSAIILFLAPIQDKNKPLDQLEKQVYGNRAKFIVIIEFISAATLHAFHFHSLGDTIFYVIFLVGLSVLFGYIKNKKEMMLMRND